ncbi:MAG: AAA family ATPase [Deltaproteobacteria bacterium]|nr:AAA family ATPase [Deltaproteobacteria bacterium]
MSGYRVEPESALKLWQEILSNKWVLSERVGRDVGMRVACIDYIENRAAVKQGIENETRLNLLRELNAGVINPEIWATISETQPPKQIVTKKIVLPILEPELAAKHGVKPPKTLLFFGPPGTGKTHFVQAIAAKLGWWYVEVNPSMLLMDGQERLAANLRELLQKVETLDSAVVFIDEFEEIAGSRDQATRLDKSVTNELLKQVPRLRRSENKLLFVCATNYIRDLDAALLRPGRFDYIIPVGSLDPVSRERVLAHYLARVNAGNVNLDKIVAATRFFTPADIEYLFQRIAHTAFESEVETGKEILIETETILRVIPTLKPSLTEAIQKEFAEDQATYTRY